MKNSEDIFKEMKAISPFLAGLKKENSFQVSDEYFDELSSKIQHTISTEKNKTKIFSLFNNFRTQWAVAASVMIIFSISVVYYYNHKQNTNSLAEKNNIYWDEILNDTNAVIDRIDEKTLVEVLANETKSANFQFKNSITKTDNVVLDDISSYVDSKYENDIFNEL